MNKTIKEMINDWPSFFAQIRNRPGMWLGEPSLQALYHVIGGIWLAESIYDIRQENRLSGFPFDEFEAWADQRFNPNRLSIRSFGMAARLAEADEAAFYLWFQWYDQFNRERNPD